VSARRSAGQSARSAAAVRIGLFGGLGSGNIGNDASMEAMLGYLRTEHPDAILDTMCGGPQTVRDRYGVAATPLQWYRGHEQQASRATAIVLKTLGKGIDAFRTASWVRRHDAVIVPGMGILETSLPVRPWQFPCAMFLLCASGRIFGTKVALVGMGSNLISKRLTRWLLISAARLASYRSYRDTLSRDAVRQQGVDTAPDHVYADLVFSAPVPGHDPGDVRTVGIGVMDYHGSNEDDRSQAGEIHAAYVAKMKFFARWLVDSGRKIRLFVGDTNGSDDCVVREIVSDLRSSRPDLDPTWVTAQPVSTFAELMRAMAPVGTVVATRYHNVICSLMLTKPTISIEYDAKNTALMADMGLAGYCQSIGSLDVGRLVEQFTDLEKRAEQLRPAIAERNAANERLLARQFAELSAVLFPAVGPTQAADQPGLARPSVG
jgi:polysaccharide pyruvyl transferase WcaK-like protein